MCTVVFARIKSFSSELCRVVLQDPTVSLLDRMAGADIKSFECCRDGCILQGMLACISLHDKNFHRGQSGSSVKRCSELPKPGFRDLAVTVTRGQTNSLSYSVYVYCV
jgi:hypothetical protein